MPQEFAFYKMNDDLASTVVVDDGSGSINGTLNGGENTEDISQAGLVDKTLNFNGSDQYVNTNQTMSSIFNGSFSITGWVRMDDGQSGSNQYFFGTNDTVGADYGVTCRISPTGFVRFGYEVNDVATSALTDSAVFANGASDWVMLTFVADSTVGGTGGLSIYIGDTKATLDGSQPGDTSGQTFGDWAGSVNGGIAAIFSNGSPSSFMGGDIDIVRFFDVALTQEQVTLLNNGGLGTETALDDLGGDATVSATVTEIATLINAPIITAGTGQTIEPAVIEAQVLINAPNVVAVKSATVTPDVLTADMIINAPTVKGNAVKILPDSIILEALINDVDINIKNQGSLGEKINLFSSPIETTLVMRSKVNG